MFFLVFSSIIFTNISFAQDFTVADLTCPQYNFTRTLLQGDRGADVKLIQKILNLDYRTRIALSGPGSSGSETAVYGIATREAVKRFQALFIELIGVADGKINSRTMTVLNSVCKGPYFTGGGGDVFDINRATTTKDIIAPSITISAPSAVYAGESYRLWLYASEPIAEPSIGGFIVSNGAKLSDMRKENPSTYKVLVTPTKTATHTIAVQLEADSVRDLTGNKNTNASNEISTVITPAPVGPDITKPSVSLINTAALSVGTYGTNKAISVTVAFSEPILASTTVKLNDFIITGPIALSNLKKVDERLYSVTVTATGIDKAVATMRLPAGLVSDLSGNKNNASEELTLVITKPENPNPPADPVGPISDPYVDSGGGGGGLGDLLQMLGPALSQGLKSLLGNNLGGAGTPDPTTPADPSSSGSGLDYGGNTGAIGKCMCTSKSGGTYFGQATYFLTSTGPNPTGGYLSPAVPLLGCSVGKYSPFAGVCGQREICIKRAFGGCRWVCQGPRQDSNGSPMVGIVISAKSLGAGGSCAN